jgi:hypothetical protein
MLSKKSQIEIIILFVVQLFVPPVVYGAVYVVDVDAGGCFSLGKTHSTVSAAVTAAAATVPPLLTGHTIYICEGTYSESSSIGISGPNLDSLTIWGEDIIGTVVTTDANSIAFNIFDVSSERVEFKQLTTNYGLVAIETSVTGERVVLSNVIIEDTGDDGLRFDSNFVTLTDVTVNSPGGDGVEFTKKSDRTIFSTGLTVTHSPSSLGNCVFIAGGAVTNSSGINRKITFINTTLNACKLIGLRANKQADWLEVDGLEITSTVEDHCVLIQGGDKVTNSNSGVTVQNITVENCGNENKDAGLFINVKDGDIAAKVTVSNITVLNSGRGVYLRDMNGGGGGDVSISDVSINNSAERGFWLRDINNVTDISNINIVGSGNDGLRLQSSNGNVISGVNEVTTGNNDGIQIDGTSTGNTISGFVILENNNRGLFVSAADTGNTFYNNCFRNTINASVDASSIFFNSSVGNFWGSAPVGTGFSELCIDVSADVDICDSPYTVPGAGSNSDNFPLQFCPFFTESTDVTLNFSKVALTILDPSNAADNPKAIPGATIMYTLEVVNNGNLIEPLRSGMGQDINITDNLDAQITAGSLQWQAGFAKRSAPDYDSVLTLVTDTDTDSDDAEFTDNKLLIGCGDLNVTEQCTVTFEVKIN